MTIYHEAYTAERDIFPSLRAKEKERGIYAPPLCMLKIELSCASRERFLYVFNAKVMAQIMHHAILEPKDFAVRGAALIYCHTLPNLLERVYHFVFCHAVVSP